MPEQEPAPSPAAGPNVIERVLFVDTETTGLDALRDRIIEIGAVEAVGDVEVACWSTLVRPGRPVPGEVTRLTGLDDASVASGVDERVALVELCALVARVDVVYAWNVGFDHGFVAALAARCAVALPPTRWACAMEATRVARPDLPGYRLSLVARDLGIPTGRSHRALDDARCAWAVWRSLPRRALDQPRLPLADTPTRRDGDGPAQDDQRAPRSTLALFR